MHRIPCPHCGLRDEIEFRYRGDATRDRPAPEADAEAFVSYVYERDNPRGWHVEWWQHTHGCRETWKVVRHTLTHDIAWIGTPSETPVVPREAGP